MNQHHNSQLKAFSKFVRTHQAMWSHIGVAGVAVRVESDQWLALWLTMVLGDHPIGLGILEAPVLRADDIIAFRLSVPSQQLWPLLGDLLRGQISPGRLPGLPAPILVTSPPGEKMSSISFNERLNFHGHMNDDAGGWPHAKIELQSGTLNNWEQGYPERYERLNKAVRMFGLHYADSIAEFALKLGAASKARRLFNED